MSGRKIRETRGKRGYKRPLILDYKDSDLPDRWEAELHVHIAHTHYSGTERASFDHTSIVRAVIKDSCHMRDKMLSAMKSSINHNLCGLFSGVERVYGPEGREIVKQLTGGFCQSVMDDARAGEYRASKRMKYSFPTDHREVAKKYTTGVNSIIKCLPIPSPEVVEEFGGAIIPVRLLVNHILAKKIPIKHFDTDADWTDDNGNYEGEFYRIWHEKIKEMKKVEIFLKAQELYSSEYGQTVSKPSR